MTMDKKIWWVRVYWDFDKKDTVVRKRAYTIAKETPKMFKLVDAYDYSSSVHKDKIDRINNRDMDGFNFYTDDEDKIMPLLKEGIDEIKRMCELRIAYGTERLNRISALEERIQEKGGIQ